MFLKQLYARNFRNFEEISCGFVDGINEVVGDNAQGKTSLLEALFLCMPKANRKFFSRIPASFASLS